MRPTGVYHPRQIKTLVWLAAQNREIGLAASTDFLASKFGQERDGNLPPALTKTERARFDMARPKVEIAEAARNYRIMVGGKASSVRVLPKKKQCPVVYFVRAENGLIKIGSTKYLEDRLYSLRCGSPVGIELVACLKGDRNTEFKLHARFAEHRLHGEWFNPAPEILAEIDRLNRELAA